ncbi:MAG TPA: ABC transporter substrate-binding protein [Candidatus Saccharimonadales bacterium]|jgi:branched-chain amino acid transport system substrate-binding protein|nr:ABC transporter substrate-binding protein [Candidatus Saccharimonadales bacterium]
MKPRLMSALAGCLLALLSGYAGAQAKKGKLPDVIKIGVLTDMSGVYSDLGGPGAVAAAQMAVDEFGGKVLGKPVQVVYADHQNKADVGANKAREWFDTQGVGLIVDVPNSGVAIAVSKVANEKHKIFIVSGAGSSRLTNEDCNPYTIHYVYDTYATGGVIGRAVVQHGGTSWFFITADYAFGKSLQEDTTRAVKAAGGQIVGSVLHQLSTADFSSYLLQAQSSKAKVIGLANAGGDTINSIKTAAEFGITKQQKLAGLLVFIVDINSIGLETAQGMYVAEGFYWDLNDDARKFGKAFFSRMKKMPTMSNAGIYSSVLQYLKAIQATGTDDPDVVLNKLKATPINDAFVKNGKIRADGRMVHDFYLFQVKSPAESKYPWDYYKLVATVPGDQAFQPLSESRCALVKK